MKANSSLSVFDEILIKLEVDDMLKIIKKRRKKLIKRMRYEHTKQMLSDAWYQTNPLPRLIWKYLDNRTPADLWNLCENVIYRKAHGDYSKGDLKGTDKDIIREAIKPVLDYLMVNDIPDGLNRNRKLFKNLAIAFILGGYNQKEVSDYAKGICSKCKDKSPQEIYGWIQFFRRKIQNGEQVRFNPHEINQVMKELRKC